MKDTKLAQSHYHSMLTDFQYAGSHAMIIRDFVKNGTTSWDELGFTDADVAARFKASRITSAKSHYRLMLDKSEWTPALAGIIREMVNDGTTTWDELGFTDADIAACVKTSRIALAKKHYCSMQEDRQWAWSFAGVIREMVNDGTTTWDELGFTDADVAARLPAEKAA